MEHLGWLRGYVRKADEEDVEEVGLRCSSSEVIRRGFGMVQGSIVVVAVEVVVFEACFKID